MAFELNRFWEKKNLISKSLKPISYLYQVIANKKLKYSYTKKVSIPVISIGNLTVGGTGKTPITRYLVKSFQSYGLTTATILRGYKGRVIKTTKVDIDLHNSQDVGDEALLHAKDGNTWISPNRYLGAIEAERYGAEIIFLDDAHQHYSLHKDFSIVVIDSKEVFGNEEVLPSGPLREGIDKGLRRADAIVICGDKTKLHKKIKQSKKPIFYTRFLPDKEIENYKNQKANILCAIRNPERFFKMLFENKIDIIEKNIFRDHYQFKRNQIERVLKRSEEINAITITTEKDIVKIDQKLRKNFKVIKIRTNWENNNLVKLIYKILFRR